MGTLVVCRETKLLGKGQSDRKKMLIVRMMEYKKRINI